MRTIRSAVAGSRWRISDTIAELMPPGPIFAPGTPPVPFLVSITGPGVSGQDGTPSG
jgi:hypothetical protein